MALPTSPPISLTQIQDEFGAPRGTGITSFYRGGTYVPNTTANAGVPASGAISLLDLLGASKTVSNVLMKALTSSAPPDDFGSPGALQVQIQPGGQVVVYHNGQVVSGGWTWLVDGVASEHELFVSQLSAIGGVSSPTLGTWLSLGSLRTFSVVGRTTGSGNRDSRGVFDVTVRHAGLGKTYGPYRWDLTGQGGLV